MSQIPDGLNVVGFRTSKPFSFLVPVRTLLIPRVDAVERELRGRKCDVNFSLDRCTYSLGAGEARTRPDFRSWHALYFPSCTADTSDINTEQ